MFFKKVYFKTKYILTIILSKLIGRHAIDKRNRKNLKNTDFSIISSNCNGGVICHDLDVQFKSPFVNLRIDPKDYIKMLKNLKYYMDCDLKFIDCHAEYSYPVAMLDDVKLYFMHYSSDDEAKDKWNKRKNRINWDNLFILFTDRDGCKYDDLEEFDKLPYKNKIVFCHKKHPNIKSSVFIKGFEKDDQVGVLLEYRSEILQKRYIDDFNYVKWLNDGKNKV